MDIRDPVVAAILIAAIVFATLALATVSLHEDVSPNYFDTAGKYIHKL